MYPNTHWSNVCPTGCVGHGRLPRGHYEVCKSKTTIASKNGQGIKWSRGKMVKWSNDEMVKPLIIEWSSDQVVRWSYVVKIK